VINKPTVLILGAGASHEYEFHLGRRLMFEVLKACADPKLKGLCDAARIDPEPLALLASVGHLAQAPSIDTLLEYRTEFAEVGKAAIAYVMIPQEKDVVLSPREKQRWYEYLFQRMLDQARVADDFAKNQLAIVTFNYDRSLEFFLFQALRNMYNIDEAKTVEIMKAIPIIHIYGKLGEPSFMDSNGRRYGTPVNYDEIRKCVDGIKIISERDSHSSECQEARELLKHAERICFLGFSYDATNLKRILPSKVKGRIYGTTYEMGNAEVLRAEELLRAPMSAAGKHGAQPRLSSYKVLQALTAFEYLLY